MLSARLQQQALEAAGTVNREIADRIRLQKDLASAAGAEHRARVLRCHWWVLSAWGMLIICSS